MAVWKRDSTELFYVTGAGVNSALMAVSIGRSIPPEVGAPKLLFRVAGGAVFDVSPKDQFLAIDVGAEQAPPVTIALNWAAALKE